MDSAALPKSEPVSIEEATAILTAPGAPFEMEAKALNGRPLRIWKNAPHDLRQEVLDARAFGRKVFLVHEDERVTFEGFYRAASAFALRLQADGVGKGDRVALVGRNSPEWVVAFFGAVMVGAIVAPLNAWWTGGELEYGLIDCGAKVLVVDAERWERIAPHRGAFPNLQNIYTSRHPGAPGVTRLESVIGEPNAWDDLPDRPPPDTPIESDDDAVVFYTSGTSGRPKGALATHRNITCNVMAAAFQAARGLLRQGLPPSAADGPQKGYLAGIPFFHATGFCALLQICLARGYKVGMMRKWDVVQAFQLIERERLTNAGGVPTLAWQMLQHPRRGEFDLSSLEMITYGGAPAAPEIVPGLKQAFPTALTGIGWGMSETCASFAGVVGLDYETHPTSAGIIGPVGDARIVDMETMRDLPIGEVGELWVRGPQVVTRYWNNPKATAETFVEGGWLRTGDLARLGDEGRIYIVDRAKDVIIRGGENIYSIEVENALFEHPAVADAALVGIPHETLGEEAAAVIVLKPRARAAEADIQAFVRERLAAFKVPARVVFSSQPLPRNANGKVLKTELRTLLADDE